MKQYPFFVILALLACFPSRVQAQLPAAGSPPMFPFVLPWDDATPGTVTDVSFLNAKPAGVNGYIVARGGHFVESGTNKRIRFLGTNFAARDAFPSHADAEKVAARIAKLGINIVRLHHLDNSGWGTGSSLWDLSVPDRQHFDPAQLDKLDYLMAQFKKNGVYVNLNLHVSRQFSEADGFPPSVSQIPFIFDKRVDEFDRRMILLQKNYAHDLLLHVNPYTGLSYAADPAVAVMEINNENSLVGDAWYLGMGLETLPEPFRGELAGFWNNWLQRKYGTDTKLKAAWLAGVTPSGPSLVGDTSRWTLEKQGTAQAEMIEPNPLAPQLPLLGTLFKVRPTPAADAKINVTKIDTTDWHVQLHQTGLDLHNGDTYTVTFRAKADFAHPIQINAGLDEADWHGVGMTVNTTLTPEWKMYQYSFTAHDTVPHHNRISFVLGAQIGTVWISDFQIAPGATGAGLLPGQSLVTRTVDLPLSVFKTQQDDWINFLADTERAYAEEMRGYLKNDLHVHANIACSQIAWGGLTGINRETNMDFTDNHAYWQHPSFPHKAWDADDWNIPNTPMVADLANGGGGTLRDLAEYRVAGKPYTISEYNHPAPNDYRAEMLPILATFAAFQDWDAIYEFDYGGYGAGVANDKIYGFFGLSADPAKTAFLPAAAMIFRGMQFDAIEGEATLHVSRNLLKTAIDAGSVWDKASATAKAAFLAKQLAVAPDGFVHGKPIIEGPTLTDNLHNANIQVVKSDAGSYYAASMDAQYVPHSVLPKALVGYVGGQAISVGGATFTFPKFGNNFAAVTLTPMGQNDYKPNGQPHRMLLTLVGKVENQGMVWNADRTSIGDQWGHGPTVAEGIPATITLKTDAARHVWALDGTGKRAGDVPAAYANGSLTFTVGPQYKTLWYEIGE